MEAGFVIAQSVILAACVTNLLIGERSSGAVAATISVATSFGWTLGFYMRGRI